jgi:tRNA A-37 threonylcarbamoyl transferase component Bud32
VKLVGAHGIYTVEDEPFNSGGEAQLYRVVGEPLLFKRYRPSNDAGLESVRLEQVVATGRRLQAEASATHPARRLNLPIDLVRDPELATVAGVLLPLAPARFIAGGRGRELTKLYYARAKPPGAEVRLAVMVALAAAVARLHDAGWVHGDLSANNVLWTSERPLSGAYVIDCDGVFQRTSRGPEGRSTSGWTDPRLIAKQIAAHDEASDLYALALAVWRAITKSSDRTDQDDHGAVVPQRVPTSIPRETRRLLNACFREPLEPAARPRAALLHQTLVADFFPDGKPAADALRRIDDPSAPKAPRKKPAPKPTAPPEREEPWTAPPTGGVPPAPPPDREPPRRTPSPPPRRRWPAVAAVLATALGIGWAAGAFDGQDGAGATTVPTSATPAGTAEPTATPAKTAKPKRPKAKSKRPTTRTRRTSAKRRASTPRTTTRSSGGATSTPRPATSSGGATSTPRPTTSSSGGTRTAAAPPRSGGSGGLSGGAGGGGSGGGGGGGLSGSAGGGGSGSGSGGLSGSADGG